VWFGKEPAQPLFAANRAGKVELMENRKLFFLVKDGDIVK
jgi:hypothetical protein